MEECAPTSSPTFSRMSGIQEWKNSICLFVNVYGEGYKNVFLENGRFITCGSQGEPSWREESDVDEFALEGEWSDEGVDSEWTSSKIDDDVDTDGIGDGEEES